MSNDKKHMIYGEYVDESVYNAYQYYRRRSRYYEEDIKLERVKVEQQKGKITFIPSKEDSYDRLIEKGREFADINQKSVDELVELAFIKEAVDRELNSLPEKDRDLVIALIYMSKSENDIAKELGVSQPAIHKRKKKIYSQLSKKLIKFLN